MEVGRSPLVVRQSSSRLARTVRASILIGLPTFGLIALVQLWKYPIENGIAYVGTIAVMALAAWLFLTEAEIVVDQSTIAKRNLIGIWRHAPLTDVAGIGFRRIGIKHVGIVYRRDRRCIFWLTSDVWYRDGLHELAERLGGSSVERASTYTDITREFPGTCPRSQAFYARHSRR